MPGFDSSAQAGGPYGLSGALETVEIPADRYELPTLGATLIELLLKGGVDACTVVKNVVLPSLSRGAWTGSLSLSVSRPDDEKQQGEDK